ncbi:MAG: peptide-methionine (S)-S-oxide reductase MsrA [Gammaproteobacteria bacterium]|nr:peptide-methionine (S)-S-oxide reductase MsrA [Gammaproteobacteria bacterium]
MKIRLPEPHEALAGRDTAMPVEAAHLVLGNRMTPPFDDPLEVIYLGMGCFWGAERMMWRLPGVFTTAVGYQGGSTKNPTYEEVCSGLTGHAEVVLVAVDRGQIDAVLTCFWEGHDPTQGMRQGNDIGTQYRSAIYFTSAAQEAAAHDSKARFQTALSRSGYGEITTEIAPAGPFYYAEPYHQQYLERVPGGYCGLGGTGVKAA